MDGPFAIATLPLVALSLLTPQLAFGNEVLVVQAPPNSRCEVQPDISSGSQGQTSDALADAAGAVRFFAPPVAWGTKLRFGCSDPATGATSTVRVDVGDAATFTTETDDGSVSPVIRVRPPLAGDPMALSANQLMAAGYPPRPDPRTQPAQFATWLTAVSVPRRIHQAKLIAGLGQKNDALPPDEPYPNGNWTGPMLVNDSHPATYNFATMEVEGLPSLGKVKGQPTNSQTSIWVGLGGSGGYIPNNLGGALLQTGVLLFAQPDRQKLPPKLWFQYIDNNGSNSGTQYVSGMQVTYGDTLQFWVWASDVEGNVTMGSYPFYPYLDYVLVDVTTNDEIDGTPFAPPAGIGPFRGESAEFIVENPEDCNGQCPLEAFTTFSAFGSAWDPAGYYHDITTDHWWEALDTNINYSGDTLSTFTWGNGNENVCQYSWLNYQ